jgi:hypothetical protein
MTGEQVLPHGQNLLADQNAEKPDKCDNGGRWRANAQAAVEKTDNNARSKGYYINSHAISRIVGRA